MEKSLSGVEIIRKITTGNDVFVSKIDKDQYKEFRDSQTPEVTLVTCSDSRVQPLLLGMDPTNEVFIIRNIGNQIIPIFGSVDYGVLHLHTPILLIMGHTHCGAIKSVLSDYEEEPFDIIRELDHLSIPVRHIKHAKAELENVWLEAVEENVDYQVRLAVKKYKRYIESGKLSVVGIVDDFIDAYNTGIGRIQYINVNDITNIDDIKNHNIFSEIDKDMKDLYIRRNTIK